MTQNSRSTSSYPNHPSICPIIGARNLVKYLCLRRVVGTSVAAIQWMLNSIRKVFCVRFALGVTCFCTTSSTRTGRCVLYIRRGHFLWQPDDKVSRIRKTADKTESRSFAFDAITNDIASAGALQADFGNGFAT